MKLIGKTEGMATVAARWRRQYPEGKCEDKSEAIYKALMALDPATATCDDAARIIGNRSWAGPQRCDECGAQPPETVRMGDDEYNETKLQFCQSCLTHALRLLKR